MVQKTKITATIGPASWDPTVLKDMITAGMTVARVNASFADHAELKRVATLIRSLSEDVALMMDTKGHKIRISNFAKDKLLKTGQKFSLFTEKVTRGVYLVGEGDLHLETQLPPETVILIDDGLIKLQVQEVKATELVCDVIQGGRLKRNKTVNIPGVHIDFPQLSHKDYEDILSAKELQYDFIAASFIRNTRDLQAVKKVLGGSDIKIIAKIEDIEGVNNFESILEEADGIMIARGDLGVEIPAQRVPLIQKEFIRKCNQIGKPVIVATQMLQSMTENITPTRAEVNDVANAIFDGTDAIMLSAETSTGKHPVEAVQTMQQVSLEVERSLETIDRDPSPLAKPTTNAMAKAVIDSCQTLPIDKILVATATGTTAKTIARFRPYQPIFAFTGSVQAKRKLALSRGIIGDILQETASTRDTGVQAIVRSAKTKGYVHDSDLIIVIAGANIMGQGETNMMEINRVDHII